MEANGRYYLGRVVDPGTRGTGAAPLLYDPDDLTTHAIVVGMTGSGKTGLCLDLLEEAALNKVPALMIDPKGDITNALLHFPDLAPADFEPWIDAAQARRDGISPGEQAAKTAALWRNGLEQWEIGPERIRALGEAAQFTIFTPGSDAGVSVSILASLAAPGIAWEANQELLREKISSTVTGLLGLIGLQDIDPIRSREHILLANIFESAWQAGQDLTLPELIMQTQSPPFEKLGVFEIDRFFPEKDRFELAMALNNILAAPAFQSWIEGQPLDVQGLLYTPNGQPRHSVFYIAHLGDAERMFFVSLLLSSLETWMRAKSGSDSLRALLYFDEIFGYLPPIGEPPSKRPLLRLLKQARAFGVGLVLATQNPVDIDYKGISNAGSWFIGKLQTERDKERLMDGLSGAAGGLDRAAYEALISGLGKRVFLLHNVHEAEPVLFRTRWAMNYMAGPLTRNQIPALNALAGVGEPAPMAAQAAAPASAPAPPSPAPTPPAAAPEETLPFSRTRPALPARTGEYFLPVSKSLAEAIAEGGPFVAGLAPTQETLLYRPALLAQADIHFFNRKYNLDLRLARSLIVDRPAKSGRVDWGAVPEVALDKAPLTQPEREAVYAQPEAPLNDASALRAMAGDYEEWIYRNEEALVRANEALKIYAGPNVEEAEFQKQCEAAAEAALKEETAKIEAKFDRSLERMEEKLVREQRELAEDEDELAHRKREEGVSYAETLLGFLGKRRRSLSTPLSKRRMTERAKADVEESKEEISDLEEKIDELEEEMAESLEEAAERWKAVAEDVTEIVVHPYKKDIHLARFGVAWRPYYLVRVDERLVELPAYEGE